MTVYQILKELGAESGRNAKIEILEREKDNEMLKRVVSLALDPFTQFYIRKIPKYETNYNESFLPLETALDRLEQLSTRDLTGNAAIDFLATQLSLLSPEDAYVIERVISKDLKCGVSVSTANKVWDDLVGDYPCMLCSPMDEKTIGNFKFPGIVQLKMDGMRFNAIVKNNTVEIRSRNGKEIKLLGKLDDAFLHLASQFGDSNVVFDGELVVWEKGEILDRQTGNGILNKAVKGTIKEDESTRVHAVLWDVIPYTDFVKGICKDGYQSRFYNLGKAMAKYIRQRVRGSTHKIKLVQSSIVDSLESAQQIFEMHLANGEEGIILKSTDGAWENKRVKHQIKFKGEYECDLEVIDYEEGTGKYEGQLGALVLGSRSSDTDPIVVSVGSGFNDTHRSDLWDIRDELIGKIVAVKYNARIKSKTGGNSLFLPIFLEIREDKTESDSEKDIK